MKFIKLILAIIILFCVSGCAIVWPSLTLISNPFKKVPHGPLYGETDSTGISKLINMDCYFVAYGIEPKDAGYHIFHFYEDGSAFRILEFLNEPVNESNIDSIANTICYGGNYSLKADTITYWSYYPFSLQWSANKYVFKVIDKNTLLLTYFSPFTQEGDEFPRYYSDTLTTIHSDSIIPSDDVCWIKRRRWMWANKEARKEWKKRMKEKKKLNKKK